jgi:hypothetical protein
MGLGNRDVVCFKWGVNGMFYNNYWRGRLKEIERGRLEHTGDRRDGKT